MENPFINPEICWNLKRSREKRGYWFPIKKIATAIVWWKPHENGNRFSVICFYSRGKVFSLSLVCNKSSRNEFVRICFRNEKNILDFHKIIRQFYLFRNEWKLGEVSYKICMRNVINVSKKKTFAEYECFWNATYILAK